MLRRRGRAEEGFPRSSYVEKWDRGVSRSWKNRSRRIYPGSRAVSVDCTLLKTTGQCCKEGRGVLNTLEEASIMKMDNCPPGTMEAFCNLDKGV